LAEVNNNSPSLTKDCGSVHIHSHHPLYISRQNRRHAIRFDWMQPELGAPIATHVREVNIHEQVTC